MNEQAKTVVAEHGAQEATLQKYIAGFVGSVALTLMSYLLVTHHAGSKGTVVGFISALAVIQFIVQMVFFLHIGEERKPRWKLFIMLWMISIVLILVVGSLWIMNNLNYRMTPDQIQQYMKSQDAL